MDTTHGGYVYLIFAANGLTKIGKSRTPDTRIQNIVAGSPIELYPLIAFPYQQGHNLERELHDIFAGKRVRGEWFNLQPDDFETLFALFDWQDEEITNRDDLLTEIRQSFERSVRR